MNQQRKQFDSDLTEALAADDVVAALDELSQRYAGDAQAGERIRSARRVVGKLISLGERLANKPTPTMPKLNLPARRIRPWWIAVPAAVAAAVIFAVLLTNQGKPTAPRDDRQLAVTPPPVESVWLAAMSGAADFNLPVMNNPPWPSLEMPAITTPTVGGFSNTAFSIPAFTWPQTTNRSTNNET